MQFIHNKLTSLINNTINNETEKNLLIESQKYIMKLHVACEDNDRIYIIMYKSSGGELFEYSSTFGPNNISHIKSLFRQFVLGTYALHKIGIAHRDMSLENILFHENKFDNQEECKIIDFGLCQKISCHPDDPSKPCLLMKSSIGKQYYIPYECLYGRSEIDGFSCDIWALGVILFIMITGNAPFNASNRDLWYRELVQHQLSAKVIETKYPVHQVQSLSSIIPIECMDALNRCLEVVRTNRINIAELISHPWLQIEQPSQQTIDMEQLNMEI